MTIRGPFNFEARQLVLFGAAAIVLLVFLFGPTSTNLLSKSLRMSAIGTWRTLACALHMSAIGGKADVEI